MYEKTTTLSLLKKINILAWVVVYLIIFAQPVLPEKQPDNIKQCFTCFLKKFSDWTWEQEKRLGMREDPKYITCRRYKRVQAKEWTTGLFIQRCKRYLSVSCRRSVSDRVPM